MLRKAQKVVHRILLFESAMEMHSSTRFTTSCRADEEWHHVVVNWEGHTGLVTLYFDGK